MGRMHTKGKGIAGSTIPYKRSQPSWSTTTKEETIDQICRLARKGLTPSQIGVILRDSHGIGQQKAITGSRVARILKSRGM